jgi:hypothetical protein
MKQKRAKTDFRSRWDIMAREELVEELLRRKRGVWEKANKAPDPKEVKPQKLPPPTPPLRYSSKEYHKTPKNFFQAGLQGYLGHGRVGQGVPR